jgi:hypothetical protein
VTVTQPMGVGIAKSVQWPSSSHGLYGMGPQQARSGPACNVLEQQEYSKGLYGSLPQHGRPSIFFPLQHSVLVSYALFTQHDRLRPWLTRPAQHTLSDGL